MAPVHGNDEFAGGSSSSSPEHQAPCASPEDRDEFDILGVINSALATPAPSYHSHLNPETDLATLDTARNRTAPEPASHPNEYPAGSTAAAIDSAAYAGPGRRNLRETCANCEWYKAVRFIWVMAVIFGILFAMANLIMFFAHHPRHTSSHYNELYWESVGIIVASEVAVILLILICAFGYKTWDHRRRLMY